MKTFRCVFQTDSHPKTVDVVAPDPRVAASRAAALFQGLRFKRIDVEDERGLAYMWQARPNALAGGHPQAA